MCLIPVLPTTSPTPPVSTRYNCRRRKRQSSGTNLAGPWRFDGLEGLVEPLTPDTLAGAIDRILVGRMVSRGLAGFTYSNVIARFVPQKPPGAWTPEQVVDYMLESLEREDFYVICPDGDTSRELDNPRMQWNTDDIIKNRPALSRWHPDFAAEYEAFIEG